MTSAQLLSAIYNFWFAPQSAAAVCLFRIVYGILAIACGLFWLPGLLAFFGPKGLVSVESVHRYDGGPRFSLLYWLPQTDGSVVLLFAVFMLAALCVTMGLFTRLSTIVLFVCMTSFDHRNPFIMNSGDTILRLLGFFLIFAPAGALYSLDALRQGSDLSRPERLYSPWAQRLMQLQLLGLYCQSFWAKMIGDPWFDGTAIYYATHLHEYQRFPVPFLFDNIWTLRLLTWGTLVMEFALWTLIWIKDLRYWVLAAAVFFHAGIEWSMNIPLFELIVMAAFITFIEPNDVKTFITKIGNAFRRFPFGHTISNTRNSREPKTHEVSMGQRQ